MLHEIEVLEVREIAGLAEAASRVRARLLEKVRESSLGEPVPERGAHNPAHEVMLTDALAENAEFVALREAVLNLPAEIRRGLSGRLWKSAAGGSPPRSGSARPPRPRCSVMTTARPPFWTRLIFIRFSRRGCTLSASPEKATSADRAAFPPSGTGGRRHRRIARRPDDRKAPPLRDRRNPTRQRRPRLRPPSSDHRSRHAAGPNGPRGLTRHLTSVPSTSIRLSSRRTGSLRCSPSSAPGAS